jgi:hypothetical protein
VTKRLRGYGPIMRAAATDRFKVTHNSNGAPFFLGIHGGSLTRRATSYNYDIKMLFLHIGSRNILPFDYGAWARLAPRPKPEILSGAGFYKLAAAKGFPQLVTLFY